MDEWIKLISTVGFPIAVSAYLLIRLETTIKELTRSVTNLMYLLARKGVTITDEVETDRKR